MKKWCILFIPLLLFCLKGSCQFDTIKVDAPVSVILQTDLSPDQLKKGDTVLSFIVVEDVLINNTARQNFLVIKKGAQVRAVVLSCVLPFKRKPNNIRAGLRSDETFDLKAPYRDLREGGELEIGFVSVQAVDGSFIPLSACSIISYGGTIGGYKNDKIMASMPAGSQKACDTKYPDAVLIIKK